MYSMYTNMNMVRFYKGRKALHAVLFAAVPAILARFLPLPLAESSSVYEFCFYFFQAYALKCVVVFLAACQADEGNHKFAAQWRLAYFVLPHVEWVPHATRKERKLARLANSIYLDFNATTPLSAIVKHRMENALDNWGNPGSAGSPFAADARRAIDKCKDELASLLDCNASQIIVTSGGTESNQTALTSAFSNGATSNRCITSAFEHPAVDRALAAMSHVEHVRVPLDKRGQIDETIFVEELCKGARLVSVMWAQNEVGSIQNIERLVALTRKHCPDALFHTDASQAVGKVLVHVGDVDYLTVAAHKFYGPKAVGALYSRSGKVTPLLHGGSQQEGRRAGTESALLCVGMGSAATQARAHLIENQRNMHSTREQLWSEIKEAFPNAERWSSNDENLCLPNTLSVCLDPESPLAHDLVLKCADQSLLFSAGAACHSGTHTASQSLLAVHVPEQLCLRTLRLTTGADTTPAQISRAVQILTRVVAKLKKT